MISVAFRKGVDLLLFLAVATLFFACPGCGAFHALAGKDAEVVALDGPALLDRSGTRYRLLRDIEVEGTAFVINASDITLDLGGHRVVYGAGEGNSYGIEVAGFGHKNIEVVQGEIVQAEGSRCRGDANARGCNPIFIRHDATGVVISGVSLRYHTPNTSGIHMHWTRNARLIGNRIEDLGSTVDNRHQGVAAVENTRGSNLQARDNRIVRTRQIGIRTGEEGEIDANEISVDSVVTNSTGIAVKSGSIRFNRIEGHGVHPIGIWPGNRTEVEGNFVRVRSTRSGAEYGSTGAACLRMTWGNDEVTVKDNLFVLDAIEGEGGDGIDGWGRALWVGLPHQGEKALFQGNLIVANNRKGKSKAAAIGVVCNNVSPGLLFKENTVISNWGHVLLADDYGHADGFPRFIANTFVRQDDFDSYFTVRSEAPGRPSTAEFIDNRYLNGAAEDRIELPYGGDGRKELRFGRTVTLRVTDEAGRPASGAGVTLHRSSGEAAFEGITDSSGVLKIEIIAYRLVRPTVTASSPESGKGRRLLRQEEGEYLVTVTDNGSKVARKFSLADGENREGVRLRLSRRGADSLESRP